METAEFFSKHYKCNINAKKDDFDKLHREYKSGNELALKKMIECYLAMTYKIASRLSRVLREDIDETMSYGITALHKAILYYNPDVGVSFSTYAYKTIRQQIIRSVSYQRYGKLDVHQLKNMIYFDSYDAEDSSIMRKAGECSIEKKDVEISIKSMLNLLSDAEADIIKMRYGLEPYDQCYGIKEIGEKYGVTRQRIQQREKAIMQKLRKNV